MIGAIILTIAAAAGPDLGVAQTPEGRLYRANNEWVRCSSYVAEKLLATPTISHDPQTIAEAAVDSCADEAAVVHALARQYAASGGRSDPDGAANAIRFELRSGIVTQLRNSIAAGARQR